MKFLEEVKDTVISSNSWKNIWSLISFRTERDVWDSIGKSFVISPVVILYSFLKDINESSSI